MLSVRDLAFAYTRARPVISGLSFTLRAGQLTAIIGPNGSGKSTLLRLLLGALKPDRGQVDLDGTPVADMAGPRLASRVAYIAQHGQSSDTLTVRQTVALGRFALPAAPGAVDAALNELGLGAHQHEPVRRLSAGQQQRVALARVAAQLWPLAGTPQPRVVLADEPASNLDPRFTTHALGTLRAWARAGACVAVVLHDLTAAARFADRALVLTGSGGLAADDHPDRALHPDQLERVFGIAFDRLDAPGGAILAARGDSPGPPTV